MLQFKRIKKNLTNNQDAKVLAANFSYLTLLQIAGYVFPLITMPYLAKVIGPIGFGKIAFASAIIVWCQTITDWGFNFTATRDVAKNRNNKKIVSEIFSNVFWCRCILMLISLIILLILIVSISKFKDYAEVILITFLLIPGHIMFPDWFFQAIERMKYITYLNIISKAIFTFSIFLFIKDSNDYILQPLFVSIGFLSSGLIAMYLIIFKWKITLQKPDFHSIYRTIKGSFDVFINTLIPNLYNSLSVIILNTFYGSTATGIYDAGKKITTIANQLLLIIARVFFPYLNRKPDKHTYFAKLSLFLAGIACLLSFIFAQNIIHLLFDENFEESIIVLRLTSISLIFTTLSSVYGTNFLLIHNKDKLLRNITSTISITSLFYSIPLIYYFNYIGTAVTYITSTMLIGSLSYLYAHKIKLQIKNIH